MNNLEIARLKYKPNKTRCLFLAEAPPALDSKRFFYFEDVSKGDSLFLQTMRALFSLDANVKAREIRKKKAEYLISFKEMGFFLEDASQVPMPKKPSSSQKRSILKAELPHLIKKLAPYIKQKTPVILISVPVYEVCYLALKRAGLNIIHTAPIPFPVRYQREYRAGISNSLLFLDKNKRDQQS